MPHGPGKYDELCSYVREQTGAEAAIVIVFGGRLGDGFSMQSAGWDTAENVAKVLERVLGQLRADVAPKGHA